MVKNKIALLMLTCLIAACNAAEPTTEAKIKKALNPPEKRTTDSVQARFM